MPDDLAAVAQGFEHAIEALALVNLDPDREPTCPATTTGYQPCTLRELHPPAVVNEDGHVSRDLAMRCQDLVQRVLNAP